MCYIWSCMQAHWFKPSVTFWVVVAHLHWHCDKRNCMSSFRVLIGEGFQYLRRWIGLGRLYLARHLSSLFSGYFFFKQSRGEKNCGFFGYLSFANLNFFSLVFLPVTFFNLYIYIYMFVCGKSELKGKSIDRPNSKHQGQSHFQMNVYLLSLSSFCVTWHPAIAGWVWGVGGSRPVWRSKWVGLSSSAHAFCYWTQIYELYPTLFLL